MATTIQNLPEIRIGRDWLLQVTEVTAQGNPLNLSNYTIELCIKANATDADNKALVKSATLYGANLPFGQYGFHIAAATTASWSGSGGITALYEIIYKDPTGI